jgi:hypothetical protein
MTVVVLIPVSHGRFSVRLGDEVIVVASGAPERDAARALWKLGHRGPVSVTRDGGLPVMDFASVEEAGRHRIEERGGNIRLWRPRAGRRADSQARYFDPGMFG